LHELRRIYCKHLLEVFASPETQELYDLGCITGRYAGAERRGFIVEAVTSVGLAALDAHES
jgi:hypothetical protein